MKSFKEYLTESKKVYDFKIKVAHECPEDCADKIKEALSVYNCTSCSSGASLPIQESHFDFPEEKNVKVTSFEVSLDYPTTSQQVRAAVATKLQKAESCIIVRNPAEEAEVLLNHANDSKPEGSLLEKDYEKSKDNQSLVGEKQKMALLKELGKNKTQGTQYKGANEKILAKKLPSEKAAKEKTAQNNTSPVGSKKITKPEVGTTGGR